MTNWSALTPQEKTDKVRELVHGGASYGQAAEILCTTRVAVAGIVYRARTKDDVIKRHIERKPTMKPAARNGPSKGGQTSALQQKAREARKHAGLTAFVSLDAPIDADPTPLKSNAWLPLPDTTPVPLAERTGCAWPCTAPDGSTLFCNAPTEHERSWCPAHHALGNRPVVVGTPKRIAKRWRAAYRQ